jgi:LysR family glycine cleavage system transcriptional activator
VRLAKLSDVLVARELAQGTLVKAFDVKLPGYGFYLVHAAGHSRDKAIDTFLKWLQAVR